MGWITAHSGCDGTKDNSLEFLTYALTTQADCLEVDVRENPQGVLVLAHDEVTGNEITLAEAFSLLQGSAKKMNCDLKEAGLEIPVYQLAQQFQVEEQLIYSGEISISQLKEKASTFPKAEVYLNIEILFPEVYVYSHLRDVATFLWGRLEQTLAVAKTYPIACVNMHYQLFTDEVIAVMDRLGLTGSAWTVNQPEDIKRLLSKGIANITTGNLKEALKLQEAFNSEEALRPNKAVPLNETSDSSAALPLNKSLNSNETQLSNESLDTNEAFDVSEGR